MKEVTGPDTGVEGGVEGGVVGGEVGGVVGGIVGGILGTPAPPTNTVVVPRDAPLPVSPMSMVYPHYPEEGRMRGWEDRVIVRYVIGTNGRVKEVLVLDKAERMAFTKSTVEAIKRWRFRPLIVNGEAKEVVHELTVYFKLEQS